LSRLREEPRGCLLAHSASGHSLLLAPFLTPYWHTTRNGVGDIEPYIRGMSETIQMQGGCRAAVCVSYGKAGFYLQTA